MNVADLVILAVLLLAALGGFVRGFIVQVAGIFGIFIGLAVAHAEYADVRNLLAQFAPHSSWLTVVSYLLVLLVVWGAVLVLARRLRSAVRLLMLGWLDRLGGAVIGVLQGVIVVELLLYLGRRVPAAAIRRQVNHSLLAPSFLHALPWLQHLFPHLAIPV